MHNWKNVGASLPMFSSSPEITLQERYSASKYLCNSPFLYLLKACLTCLCGISHPHPFADLSNEKQVSQGWLRTQVHCVYQLCKLTLKKLVLFLSQKRPCAGMCFSCCQGTPLPSSTSRAHCRFCGQQQPGEMEAGDANSTTSKSIKQSTLLFINLKCLFLFFTYLPLHSPHTLSGSTHSSSVRPSTCREYLPELRPRPSALNCSLLLVGCWIQSLRPYPATALRVSSPYLPGNSTTVIKLG